MQQLLQEFERHVTGADGEPYTVLLYGRGRPNDTWQGWLVFVRQRDNRRFATPVETTQPSAETVLYWASGLTDVYFDGALTRALESKAMHPASVAEPLGDYGGDAAWLGIIQQGILTTFQRLRDTRVLTQRLCDSLPFANADIVRALEELERRHRLLVRRTEEGSDWILLTEAGIVATRVAARGEGETRGHDRV
jgi:hypothetical protein